MNTIKSALFGLAIGILLLIIIALLAKLIDVDYKVLLLFVIFWFAIDLKIEQLKKEGNL